MPFSKRTPGDLTPNAIAKLLAGRSGDGILDLTESNPTHCGFEYPKELLTSLLDPEGFRYEPDPFGYPQARRAVAHYLREKGYLADEEKLLLTASTSEAYSYLFKLLADPGDSFLVPTPSYSLLEHLTRLEAVEALPYRLRMGAGWKVDMAEAEKVVRPDTKGLMVVNPNNPTGSFLDEDDQEKLFSFCQKRDMAYLSDEVFKEYAYSVRTGAEKTPEGILSFRMGGLSKSLGLPQLKLAWVLMDGPPRLLAECRERLELIADSYLSVNTPVQLGLSDLLKFAPVIQKQILERVMKNRRILEEHFLGVKSAKVWPAQGGWYALVERTDLRLQEEDWIMGLIKKHGVLVQPGGFYDFTEGCFAVLSLLQRPDIFKEGVARIKKSIEEG